MENEITGADCLRLTDEGINCIFHHSYNIAINKFEEAIQSDAQVPLPRIALMLAKLLIIPQISTEKYYELYEQVEEDLLEALKCVRESRKNL